MQGENGEYTIIVRDDALELERNMVEPSLAKDRFIKMFTGKYFMQKMNFVNIAEELFSSKRRTEKTKEHFLAHLQWRIDFIKALVKSLDIMEQKKWKKKKEAGAYKRHKFRMNWAIGAKLKFPFLSHIEAVLVGGLDVVKMSADEVRIYTRVTENAVRLSQKKATPSSSAKNKTKSSSKRTKRVRLCSSDENESSKSKRPRSDKKSSSNTENTVNSEDDNEENDKKRTSLASLKDEVEEDFSDAETSSTTSPPSAITNHGEEERLHAMKIVSMRAAIDVVLMFDDILNM